MRNDKDNVKVSDLGSSAVGKGELRPRFLNPVKHSYLLKILSLDARNRVEELMEIQEVHDRLKAEFYKERGALEDKYEKSYEPLYEQQYNITNGVIIDCESATANQEEKGVPNFWLFAFRGNDVLNDMIMDHDERVLKHLENVKWVRTDNLRGFKLEFYFRPNPFFKNSILTMTYHMIDDDDSIIEKVIGTEIQWHSKNCLEKDMTQHSRSFFNIFSPTEVHDKYKDLGLKYEMEQNYFIGLTIRDEIIPRAILWFTGEAALQQMTKITTEHSCFLDSLSPGVKKHVNILENIQSDHDELKKMFYKERANLEAKYQNLFQNLYDKRCDIVNGVVQAKKVSNDSETSINQEDITIQDIKAPEEKSVPNFWRHALVNHELLDAEITTPDGGALMYLKDIKCSRIDSPKGFKLEFFFNKNPFFKNSVLIKTYEFLDEDEAIVQKVTGLKIEWYPKNCLTSKVIKKPEKEINSVDIRPEQCESFFNFFDPLPIDEKAPKEHIDEMRRDLYIGLTIRDEIIPRAVLWYVGEGAQGKMSIDWGESEDEEGDEN
ncbi:nucleosome assembly protein 1;2-like [Rosa rugosa]|uniref:nucleosome assembly protein 1;2-like n=1 Tax=Rosa rugosa TaxID=74645 RepID=UPI002B402B52|nr:nucleosome assembly protein 1;2-like [Rosa rugosa]